MPDQFLHRNVDLQRWGVIGGWYLRRRPDWVARHVETIEVEGARTGRRKLTIDITIPRDPAAVVAETEERNLYCIPASLMGKRRPRSKIDLLDERGERIPLLTRRENGVISAFAMLTALHRELGEAPPDTMSEALLGFIAQTDRPALFQRYLFEYAAKKEQPELTASDAWRHIQAAAESLVNNSILWIPITGQPGERRSVRLVYQIGLGPPTLVKRKSEEREETVRAARGGEVRLFVPTERGVDVSETVRRAISRVGVRLGLAAVDLEIRAPALVGPSSYHFQVEAPPGLEVKGIAFEGALRVRRHRRRTKSDRPIAIDPFITPQSGHLYVSDYRVAKPGSLLVSLRPARAGLLSQSAVACALIAILLWIFAEHRMSVSEPESAQVSAAILLIPPALLTAFVYRPTEHALAARLLAGVRALVLLAGAASVAAAASLVGAARFGFSPEHAARAYAIVATFAGAWLLAMCVRLMPWAALGRNRRLLWTETELEPVPWALACSLAGGFAVTSLALVLGGGVIPGVRGKTEGIVLLLALVPWPAFLVSGWSAAHWRETSLFLRIAAFLVGSASLVLGLCVLVGTWEDPTVPEAVVASLSGMLLLGGLGQAIRGPKPMGDRQAV